MNALCFLDPIYAFHRSPGTNTPQYARRRQCLGTRSRVWAPVILLVLLSACSAENQLFRPHEVRSHKEAGSTHISVLAIAPWADYADSLQPKFELTGEAALQKALPTSQLFSNQLLSEINASGLVSLPTISDVQTESTIRESTGGAPEPGTLPAQGVAAGGARTAASLPALQLKQDATQKEPILQYHTALALYQEVQLLNSYVRNAAKRSGYIPYVVRLQLAVLPFARNQPYDVYADIGFFPPQTAKEDARAKETPELRKTCRSSCRCS